ncbi:calcium-binding protein [Algicella marina]|nr:calcium-binding protein [Algicella marina]
MTTITMEGYGIQFPEGNGDILGIGRGELVIAFSQNANNLRYTNVAFDDGEPISEFTQPQPIFVALESNDFPGAHHPSEVSMLRVQWGNGNVTDVVVVSFLETPFEYVGYLGGDALPQFNSIQDFENFESSITSLGPINSGPFRPNVNIPVSAFPGTTSEDDYALGTPGADTFNFGSGNDVAAGDDGNDTYHGGAGNDLLVGQNGHDTLYGDAGHDALEGGNGNDMLYGGSGEDSFVGGRGRDYFNGGASGDDILDYAWEQNIHGTERGITVNFDTGVARDTFGAWDNFESVERVYGTSEDDVFTGSDSIEYIVYRGYAGNDTINGSADGYDVVDHRRDTEWGGDSGITVDLLAGTIIDGFGDTDTVSGLDRVRGTNFDDTMVGDDNGTRLDGEGGNDHLTGGMRGEQIEGDDGNDTIFGRAGQDFLWGGSGNDRLNGQFGNDVMRGENGADILRGNQGNDWLQGGAGDDRMFGNTEDDILEGQGGNDRMSGGSGDDSFVFRGSFGRDVIFDFGSGEDLLRLDDALWGGEDLQAWQVMRDYGSVVNGNYVFEFDAGQRIQLNGLDASDMFGNIEIF